MCIICINMCNKHPWSINGLIHKVLRWISLTSFWHILTVLQAKAHWFRCFGLWRWFLQAHLASVYWVLAAARCDLIDLTLEYCKLNLMRPDAPVWKCVKPLSWNWVPSVPLIWRIRDCTPNLSATYKAASSRLKNKVMTNGNRSYIRLWQFELIWSLYIIITYLL